MGKNRYVEITKTHEMLDYLRIKGEDSLDGLLGSSEGLLSLLELTVTAKELPFANFGTLTVGKYRLGIGHNAYLHDAPECWDAFYLTANEKVELIQKDLDTAFLYLVKKCGDYSYFVDVELYDFHTGGNKPSGKECTPDVLNRHLAPYMPIIQKFMVDALTDNLYVMEDGKPVKQ